MSRNEVTNPRILIWDIETAGVNALKADYSSIVCFGYKWLGDRKACVLTVNQFDDWFSPNKGLNDKPIIKAALAIMEPAHLLVAHYGDYFDRPFFQGRCAIHGLRPPPPTKQRDTCDIARRAFRFSSNRLANLADVFSLNEKKLRKEVPSEWPGWWLRAMAGDEKAIKAMGEYCRQDVVVLEKVYLRLRQYDSPHPRLVIDRSCCGLCGGIVEYRGLAYVGQNRYRRFICKLCGRWGRETKKVE